MTNPAPGATNEAADILWKLVDLHKQATVERSHYYVASVVRESIAEITSLRHRLGKIAYAPVPTDNKIAMTLKRWAATNPGESDLPDPFTALRSARTLIADSRDNIRLDCMSNGSDPSLFLSPFDAVLAQIDEAFAAQEPRG